MQKAMNIKISHDLAERSVNSYKCLVQGMELRQCGFGPCTLNPSLLLPSEAVPHGEEIPLPLQIELPHIGLLHKRGELSQLSECSSEKLVIVCVC